MICNPFFAHEITFFFLLEALLTPGEVTSLKNSYENLKEIYYAVDFFVTY